MYLLHAEHCKSDFGMSCLLKNLPIFSSKNIKIKFDANISEHSEVFFKYRTKQLSKHFVKTVNLIINYAN